MSFWEQRLPIAVSRGATGGPVFNTGMARAPNGFRVTNKDWPYPPQRYNVGHALQDNAKFEKLRAFFYNVFGRYDGFRFQAPDDHTVVRATSSLTDLGGGDWQLNRIYSIYDRTFTRPIYKPVDGSVVVYDAGGTPLTADVDSTTGIAAVTGTPATWSGEFDVPMAFESDEAVFRLVGGPRMAMAAPNIVLWEVLEEWA